MSGIGLRDKMRDYLSWSIFCDRSDFGLGFFDLFFEHPSEILRSTCSSGELRRNRRFDHSPGNWWRTYLLPDQDFQNSLLGGGVKHFLYTWGNDETHLTTALIFFIHGWQKTTNYC